MMLSLILEVKITLKNLKISWEIFNLKAFIPLFSWPKLSQIATKIGAYTYKFPNSLFFKTFPYLYCIFIKVIHYQIASGEPTLETEGHQN